MATKAPATAPRRQDEDYWVPTSMGLLKSLAWQSCNHLAKSVYWAVATEYKRINNGIIGMGQRQVADIVACNSPRAIVDAFRQLETTGILVRTFMGHKGPERWKYTQEELAAASGTKAGPKGANRSKPKGIVSMWQMTDCPTFDFYENETPPSREYRQWKPGMDMRTIGKMELVSKRKSKATTNVKITTPRKEVNAAPKKPKLVTLEGTPVDLAIPETGPHCQLEDLIKELTDDDIPF